MSESTPHVPNFQVTPVFWTQPSLAETSQNSKTTKNTNKGHLWFNETEKDIHLLLHLTLFKPMVKWKLVTRWSFKVQWSVSLKFREGTTYFQGKKRYQCSTVPSYKLTFLKNVIKMKLGSEVTFKSNITEVLNKCIQT